LGSTSTWTPLEKTLGMSVATDGTGTNRHMGFGTDGETSDFCVTL
jgi:hypothetical protein